MVRRTSLSLLPGNALSALLATKDAEWAFQWIFFLFIHFNGEVVVNMLGKMSWQDFQEWPAQG